MLWIDALKGLSYPAGAGRFLGSRCAGLNPHLVPESWEVWADLVTDFFEVV